MSVESQNDGPLYRRSRSELTVEVPFVSPDSLVLVSDSVEGVGPTISVVPTTDEIDVSAFELQPDGSRRFLQTRTLPVTDIPAPNLDILIGNNLIDKRAGITPSRVTAAEITSRAVESFASTHPDDARYAVNEVQVTAVRGRTSIRTQQYTGGIIDLYGFRSVVEPGDALVFEITEVRRLNADGNIYSVDIPRLASVVVVRIV